jgi:DNA-binding NtrC family response regulator
MNEGKEVLRLLMVDDEEEFLAATSTALERRGLKVTTAKDGERALELAQTRSFDVVLLDVKMPDLSGIEVFRRLQQHYPGLPTVLLTGHGTVRQAFQMAKEGIYDYIAKPCEIDALAAKLFAACRAGRTRDAAAPVTGGEIRLLLVDDEIELLESLQTVLERRGMIVTTAENGEQALAVLRDTPIDVTVLDVKMPGMDGLEVLRRVKQDNPFMEVILLTGHPTIESAMKGIKQGACEYVVKPPDVEKLAATIRNAYEHRKQALQRLQQDTIREILEHFPD